MTTVYQSQIRITHGSGQSSVVLIDYDDDVGGLPALDGGQTVDLVGFVRAAGKKAFSQKNDAHTFRLPLAFEGHTVKSAHEQLFSGAVSVPKGTADVTFEVKEGKSFVLRNAAVERWDGVVSEHFTTRELVIVGGQIEEIS